MLKEILESSLGFLTTLPVEGDVEKLRRNLWVFPYAGAVIGIIVSLPVFLSSIVFELRIAAIVVYLLVEGINHIDGLADFGDALFAPKGKKRKAMKDTQLGTGAVAVVAVYFTTLVWVFLQIDPLSIIFSQILAKFAMLLLLVTSKPSWEGMASYMMRYATYRDLLIASPLLLLSLISIRFLAALIVSLLLALAVRRYAERTFGGVSGDVIGATNCIVFAAALITLA